MRERSQTTPRRRRTGPKQALPLELESHYNIDNTEDIYGTTLLPSQRCYVDPWDLENYDYVRKKMDLDVSTQIHPDYETALDYGSHGSPSPSYGYHVGAATMPRPHTQRLSRSQCQLECCRPPRRSRKEPAYRYDDHMAHMMMRQLQLDDEEQLYAEQRQLYNGYGGLSNASSSEPHSHSSIGGDELPSMPLPRRAATLQRRAPPAASNSYSSGYGTAPHPRRKRRSKSNSRAAQIDFPAPPPAPAPNTPAYDYCNPYATLPYCSQPDCSECQQQATSLIYAAPSTLYGTLATAAAGAAAGARNQSSSPSDSSLYAGIYARKFGLSKKGLLQIDYSCSWQDLDRVMARHY
ncbi:CG8854 [Drosophila busckii]|uniref:CG8854 n=1 Tax=Drosophila busckii TaxID=30019 RepID=A0A0M5J2U5_DROBS|nr:uncharacterized protein LOC108597700 [Drosophila busckii]XP_017839874.1 uncharacterized protein LOC108597700 [Drosophila busckii]ALC41836.1 CG8854 [Drosophila busckii]